MFLDHATITATNSFTEPDRLERLTRVYGYAVAMADMAGNGDFIHKVAQIHDHKGLWLYFGKIHRPKKKSRFSFVPGAVRSVTAAPTLSMKSDAHFSCASF